MTSTIRILTVDDHTLLRQGMASLLGDESDMSVVAETTGRKAVEQFREQRPDVTLMDLADARDERPRNDQRDPW